MRIGFDATAMPANRAGAGVYTYQLAQALPSALGQGDELLVFDRWNVMDAVTGHVVVRRTAQRGRGRRLLWEQTALPMALRRDRVQLFHSPHHSMPLLAPCPSVVTVHDVTFRMLPWRYSRARRWYMHAATLLAARRAAAIIVPSRSVAQDFLRLYGGDPRRVHVVPEAASPWARRVTDTSILAAVRARYGLPDRFVLSVGTLEPGKNREVLLQAMSLLQRHDGRRHLVVVGQRGWGPSLAAPEGEAAAAGWLHLTGYVPDDDLAALYSLAAVFVFPSWREGFGLPPLEAMACGTPVISSDQPAMPEVLGDAALYAPPNRPESWAAAIDRIVTDARLSERLAQAGLARAAGYSWQQAARATVDVYRSVLR